jgi:hypothetical protein
MVITGLTSPMPQMSISSLGSAIQTTAGSTLSVSTVQTLYPGETVIHILINNRTDGTLLIDPLGLQVSPFTSGIFGSTHALIVYIVTYPNGIASGSSVTWLVNNGVGAHAFSYRLAGNTALQNWGILAGTTAAQGAYWAFQNANFSTGTRVRYNYRQTASWLALTAIKADPTNIPGSRLNGLGQSGGNFAIQYNNGSNDVAAAALTWNQGPNQRPDTNIGLIQRHALAVPVVLTYWRFVAP